MPVSSPSGVVVSSLVETYHLASVEKRTHVVEVEYVGKRNDVGGEVVGSEYAGVVMSPLLCVVLHPHHPHRLLHHLPCS